MGLPLTMPLYPCPACKREVSTEAVSCPGCGHPLTPGAQREEDHHAEEPTRLETRARIKGRIQERTQVQAQTKPGRRIKMGCLTALGLFFGFVLLGVFVEPPKVPRSTSPTPNAAAPAQVSEAVPPEQRDPHCQYSGDGVLVSCRDPNAEHSSPPTPRQPKIELRLQNVEYEYGYFKVVGVARNVGTASAYSPTINLQVFDSKASETLLAEDSAWPTGLWLKDMAPGASAAFELMARVPGEPSRVRWRVSMEDYPYEIIEKGKKK